MAQLANIQTRSAYDKGHSAGTGKRTMRILVIGSTRGTGQQVMQQAIAAGHMVTALARDPTRLDVQHDRLSVVRGDVLDPATLAPAMAGQEAVISSIGVTARRPTTLYSEGMRNIIQAMHATDVKRLVAVSAGRSAATTATRCRPGCCSSRSFGPCCGPYTPTWPEWRTRYGLAASTGRSSGHRG